MTIRSLNSRAVLDLLGVLAAGETAMAQDNNPPNVMGNIINNQGIITQGQVGNNTINYGSTRLTFDQTVADELASKIPPEKPVIVHAVGTQADWDVAAQYLLYLRSKGFQVEGRRSGQLVLSPGKYSRKITIEDDGAATLVTITPSATE